MRVSTLSLPPERQSQIRSGSSSNRALCDTCRFSTVYPNPHKDPSPPSFPPQSLLPLPYLPTHTHPAEQSTHEFGAPTRSQDSRAQRFVSTSHNSTHVKGRPVQNSVEKGARWALRSHPSDLFRGSPHRVRAVPVAQSVEQREGPARRLALRLVARQPAHEAHEQVAERRRAAARAAARSPAHASEQGSQPLFVLAVEALS
eukprot:6200395-Pleurochrysis_carterae.AAC.1